MANEITKVTDKNNVDHPLRDEAAQTALTGILNGQSIDSFGDVESALEEYFPRSEQAVLGAKNLIPYPYADGMSKETNGITFTVQNDGSVVANGTATGQALFELWKINTFKLTIGKAVTLNGGIDNKAMIQYWAAADFDYKAQGSDVLFTPTTDALASGRLTIFVDTGKTLNNAVFKPMIRLATDSDDTYAPYAKTNRELTEDAEYKVGDSINITNSLWVGHLTGGSKELYCFIPLNKPVNKSVTGILFSDTVVNVRSNGDYLISNENLSNYTISNVNINSLGIFFLITKSDSSAFASFNNVPATIQPYSNNAKLTFT